MDGETEFAAAYKKLIDHHLAPEPERTEAVLRTILRLLPERDPPEKPVESPDHA